jgi:trans-aconitate methyltransferase
LYRIVAVAQIETMSTPHSQAWNPQHYDRAGAFVPRFGADVLELVNACPGERILDLGCGTADLTQSLADRGAQMIGLDASPEMVREARRKHPTLDLRQGDGQALGFDGELDAVFSNAALHWMPRADDVAHGVARALRPGGRFVAEFGGAGCVQTVREALTQALADLGVTAESLPTPGAPAWYFPTATQYAAVLERAGLFVHALNWFQRPTRLAGEAGLEQWLELFCLPLLSALGPRRAELVAAVKARCQARLFRDGDWWLDYTRLRVVATKP